MIRRPEGTDSTKMTFRDERNEMALMGMIPRQESDQNARIVGIKNGSPMNTVAKKT